MYASLSVEERRSASDWLAGVAKLLLPRRSRQLSLQQTLCGSVKYYSQQWSAMSTEKARGHVRILKWVLLVTVPRTVLDATASVLTRLGNAAAQLVLRTQPRRAALRTAPVRQDQGKYSEGNPMQHPPLETMAKRLSELLDCGQEDLCRPIIQQVARGKPVTKAELQVSLHLSQDELEQRLASLPDTEFDQSGNIVGWGVTLLPTSHQFQIDGKARYTSCAF